MSQLRVETDIQIKGWMSLVDVYNGRYLGGLGIDGTQAFHYIDITDSVTLLWFERYIHVMSLLFSTLVN